MTSSDAALPFLDHLRELRKRLLIFFSAWACGSALSYWISEEIFGLLLLPFEKATHLTPHTMIYLGLTEAFTTYLKIALWGGILLSFPVFVYQFWKFTSPGLKPKEKRVLKPFFIISPFLFSLGALFAYFIVIPLAWIFFLSFENSSLPIPLVLEPRMSDYFSLTFSFLVSFGLSFQFPLILIALAHLGIISSRGLALNRKYAIILIFIVAALLTPPDVLSQILLAIPLMILFEGTIWIIRRNERLTRETLKKHV